MSEPKKHPHHNALAYLKVPGVQSPLSEEDEPGSSHEELEASRLGYTTVFAVHHDDASDTAVYWIDGMGFNRDEFMASLQMAQVHQLARIADALERMSPPTTHKATSPEATVGDVAGILNELNKNR